MSSRTGVHCACLFAGIAVYAEFHSFRVYIVGQRFHSRREAYGVALYPSERVAFPVPCVVEIHVNIAGITESGFYQCVDNAFYFLFVNVCVEFVPAVPSHRRCHNQSLLLLSGCRHNCRYCHCKCDNRFFHLRLVCDCYTIYNVLKVLLSYKKYRYIEIL